MSEEKETAPEEGAVDDVRADILAAIEKHSAPEPEVAAEATADEGEKGEKGDKAEHKQIRVREHVRKLKPAKEQTEQAAPEEALESKEPGTDKPTEKTAQGSTPDGPPSGWPAEAKALWSQLSPAVQAAVIKREGEISNGGRQWSDEKRRYEEVLTPVRALAKRYNTDERESIQRLVAANDYLERDPVNALRWLASNFGVDFRQLLDGNAQPRVDPHIQRLHQELNEVKQTLTQREHNEIRGEIESFAKDRPHFEEVRQYMGRLLEAGAAESMSDAYDQAVWALPSVREKVLAEREATARAEREKVDRERVEKARRGAVSIKGAPQGAPAVQSRDFDSIRDAVEDAWKQYAAH